MNTLYSRLGMITDDWLKKEFGQSHLIPCKAWSGVLMRVDPASANQAFESEPGRTVHKKFREHLRTPTQRGKKFFY